MRTPDIHALKILEEINKEEFLSQRDIAKNLNVSLGLVNSFIKKLARKGYFKIVNIPKNRVTYILTPKGVAEKARLTYQYIEYSYRFYKDARKKLKDLLYVLVEQNVKRIAFYGATDLAEIAYLSLQETSIELIVIFDEDKKGENFFGFTIESMDRLNDFVYDKLFYTDEKPIEEFLQEITNISKDKIVSTSKG